MRVSSEKEMLVLGKKLGEWFLTGTIPKTEFLPPLVKKNNAKNPDNCELPNVIELIGDVGAGKTTLVRGLAEGLKIKEPIASPSFTILRTYAFLRQGHPATLSHYDFYRLDDPGLMAEDLNEAIFTPNSLVVVEWGGLIADLLPEKRLTITIKLENDGTREVKISSPSAKSADFRNDDVCEPSQELREK